MLRPRFPSCLARGPKIMKKTIIIATSGILVTKVMWQLYDAYRRSRRKEVNEVMFFSKDSTLCHSHLGCMEPCARMDCAVGHLRRIIYYLDSATDTLDVCLYLFTCPQLAEAIIKAKKRNVVIRMILDESMSQNSASQIMNFYKEGINLKSKKLDSLMHHKFVVIDNNILINGSLNWTTTAFFGNFENVQVTNVSALVKPFINEFEKMWTMLNTMATQADSIQRNLNVTV